MDSLASAVITGKVNQMTKELGDAVGLNDDGNNEEAARHARAKEDVRRQKEMQKREKEREARKKERQTERDKIREKYQLPDTSKSSSSRQQDSDSKCVLS